MGLFTWDDKKSDAPPTDEHASQHLGAANSSPASPPAGGPAAHAADAARAAALAASESSPRRRRRASPDAGARGGDSRDLQAKVDAAIAAQLDALHDPEAWAALLAMPGDVAVAITGRDYWQISKEERKTLGVTGSAAARTMMITNPRALAFTMLASALFSAYVPRATQALKEMRDAKLRAVKKPETPQT